MGYRWLQSRSPYPASNLLPKDIMLKSVWSRHFKPWGGKW